MAVSSSKQKGWSCGMVDSWGSLNKFFALAGCFLFAASILFPFITITQFTIIPELNFRLTYWSFQVMIVRDGLYRPQSENAYFDNFWFAHGEPYSYQTPSDLGISLILVSMFFVQLITSCFGVVALFRNARRHTLVPFLSSLSVFFLMIYVIGVATNRTYSRPTYEIGFWLTPLSASFFFVAHVLRSTAAAKKRR